MKIVWINLKTEKQSRQNYIGLGVAFVEVRKNVIELLQEMNE